MTSTPSNNGITTQLGDQGLGQQPWWVEQWMELINGYRFKKRLERAWAYAREGNVLSIRFEGRRVHARVQGSGEEPYKVKLWLDTLSDEDWGYVLEALGQKARWSAQLLAGVMPQDIERAFAASGRRLFPFKLQEVRSECSCPDKINPCKHASAVYYLMGERFSEDPFVLFQMRGRTRAQLLADLAIQRRELLARQARAARAAARQKEKDGTPAAGLPTPAAEGSLQPAPAAIKDPSRWWRYDAALDPGLVVITPAMEGETGLDEAGPLPLAEDARFPEAGRHFVEHLKAQGALLGQAALATAMAAGAERSGAAAGAEAAGG
ncbi:SWIM zinc finger family protein [Vulcanococcus limneticus]|uniref:SWIM zinc finger family protein n=1 Tax=Vulcanococcus limneticus TaxID=2170428 RepID=UPI00398BE1BA